MTNHKSLARYPIPGATGYLLSIALLGPFLSPLIGIWGETANVGSVLWRFGAYGLVLGGLFYLLVALAIAALLAAAQGQRKTLLALGVATTILTLLLAVGLPPFVLDFLQLKRSLNPTAFGLLQTTGIKVIAMGIVGIPVLALTANFMVRAGKALEPERRPRGAPAAGLK